MDLTSNDVEQLETFKQCLGLTTKISSKNYSKGVVAKRVQFGDVGLYRWFISVGITPRKSKTIGKVDIPEAYFFDYLRGVFDGDGSSHAYWDTRWRSSVSIYMNFASASKKHLEWLNQRVEHLIKITGCIKYGYSSGTYALQFSKQKAIILYRAMYYSSSIPFLKRKKDKLDRQWAANELSKKGIAPIELIRGGSILRIA